MSYKLSRRSLLGAAVTALVGGAAIVRSVWATAPDAKRSPNVAIENFDASGKSTGTAEVPRVVRTDAEWKKQLSNESFYVTRKEGTERAGTGKYEKNHESGLYRCICCDTALYDSKTKFESGTGWPSFWASISKLNVAETADNSFGMRRTAVSCARCDAHLGHVFDDGPRPTGLRHCINSVALTFVPRA